MKNAVLLIYPALWLILTFYRAQFRIHRKQPDIEYEPGDARTSGQTINRGSEQARLIRASACVGVILHHLTQKITGYGSFDKGPVTVFNYMGILFTALFFFYSGYGLLTSLYTKPDYLRTFLRKRLPSVLIPFWVVNLLGVLLNRFGYGFRSSVTDMLKDIFGITLVNSNGWFIVEIVFLYLFFYILFRLIRKRDIAMILLCAAVLLLIRYSFHQGHDAQGAQVHWFRGEWWYNSTITFIVGLFYARFREKVDRFCLRHYPVVLGMSAVLLAVTFERSIYAVNRYGYYHEHLMSGIRDARITLAAQMAACIAFVVFIQLLSLRITLGNKALQYMSGITVELFLIHGYFVNRIFANVRMSDFARFAVVIVCSIACTAVVSPCVQWLVKKTIAVLNPAGKYKDTGGEPVPLKNGSYSTLESEIRRKKRKKAIRIAAATAIVCAVAAGFLFGRQYLFAGKEYKEECEALRNAEIGDEVYWGHFETDSGKLGKERLTWIVIGRDGDNVCLLCKQGIAGDYYNQKHEEVSWEDSDLRSRLNSKEFTGMFSRYEIDDVIEENGDRITLLTVDEARNIFNTDQERELEITEEAELNGTNVNRMSKDQNWDMKGYRSSWWWLRGEGGEKSIYAPIVTENGTIEAEKKAVNKPGGAIRPVIWVNCGVSQQG